jgi:outer membrane protein
MKVMTRVAAIVRAGIGSIAGASLLLSAAVAQPTAEIAAPSTLTLDDAVARAIERSEEVGLARTAVQTAGQQVVVARSAAFPQLDASASYSRTFASAFDNAFSGSLSGLGGALPFGQKHTYSASVAVSQLLFAGGRVSSSIASAKHARAAAELSLREETAEIALEVRRAYYRALLATELETIAVASIDQAQKFLQQEQQRLGAGYGSDLDVLRAEVSLANLNPQLVDARNAAHLAFLDLKRLVNIPLENELTLTTVLQPPPPTPPDRPLSREELLNRRASVRAALRQVSAREADVRTARAEYFPAVSFQMSYGRQGFPTEALNFSGVEWQPDWTASIGIQVPLFTGFKRRAQVAQARIRLHEAQLQLAQLKEGVQLEYEQTLGEREQARATIAARQRTVDQANRVYELTVLRYGQGQATQLEISDSRLDLLQARTNLAQALADFYTADAAVLRATSEAQADEPDDDNAR